MKPGKGKKPHLTLVLAGAAVALALCVYLFAGMGGLPRGTSAAVDSLTLSNRAVSDAPVEIMKPEISNKPVNPYYPLTRADTERAKKALDDLTVEAFTRILEDIEARKPGTSGELVNIILDNAGLSDLSPAKRKVVARFFSARKALKGIDFMRKTGLSPSTGLGIFRGMCLGQIENIEKKLPM